jgi:squalene-associated FAD-dependent desaturase
MTPGAVVVGGGFAGLSAAALLAEAGLPVLVVEARPQLGGRATAFRDRVTGEVVDNGQHVLFGCYRETFAFLRRIGALNRVRLDAALTVPFLDRSGRRSVLACPPLPPPLHLLGAILQWPAMGWRDRLSAFRMAPALQAARSSLARTGRVAVDGDVTVSAWLRQRGQTARLTEWLWEPLALAALNQPIDEALAAPFVRVLAQMFGPDRTASAIALPIRPLNEMYALPAQAYIEAHGGEVRTGALARIVSDGRRVTGIEVRGERIAAPRVIAAVPWFGMRTLFAGDIPAPMADTVRHATAMDSKPIVTVNLWYDRPVMDEAFVGLPGRSMQWVFDKRLAFGRESSHLSLVASGADALAQERAEATIAAAACDVADALPGARTATLLRATVVREKRATFSLAAGQPRRPGTTTELEGLWLAGDWIETGLPGTIESAVVSGHAAAEAILNVRSD